MYSTCLHCHRSLGRNDAIEHFPVGRRLAFDAVKGRLWVVCSACQRWNLSPIEERWEAVESCERLFRGQPLRAQTDNIGLTRIREGTELIRVGKPLRPEFAAWRYCAVFRRRFRRRLVLAAGAGAAVATGGLMIAGAPILATIGPFFALPLVHFGVGSLILRGNVIGTRVVGERGEPLHVTLANLNYTRLAVGDDGALRLHLKHSYGRQELSGDRAMRALASILTRANAGGGTTASVGDAVQFIAEAGDPREAIARVAREAERLTGDFEERAAEIRRAPRARTIADAIRRQQEIQRRHRSLINGVEPANDGALHRLPRRYRLALEMSIHETSEQHALDDELEHLERAWREAEEIAAIADGLLTSVEG